ncbi:hypothetical protein ONZ45_g8356 [Pleurotus djamor]|nr:hypothetical protein ONZ45_g8356 [Pleurotus djamor]
MASEGMQITIPDFDDTDSFGSASVPFGRSGNPFGGAGNGLGFGNSFGGSGFGNGMGLGLESPTITTPVGDRSDRSLFQHGRGDSIASVDSANSFTTRFSTKHHNPFSQHTSQPSTSTSPFTKKPSFASIRNAFKSSAKSSAPVDVPPPVPQFDPQSYPVLKNPFNRSNSSLNQISRAGSSAPTATSPSYARPPTPGSNDFRFGSDYGVQFSSSPPPVPRVPNAFGHGSRSDSPDFDEDKVIMDPKTPADYALHAVFMRFASLAESKMNDILRNTTDAEPSLTAILASGVDAQFDATLQSLSKIAQRNCKAVVDSIMRWRKSQHDVPPDIINLHVEHASSSRLRTYDIPSTLNERKALASIYIMCRALIAVLQSVSKDALGDALGYSLEETTFEQFRRPDLKLLAQSANHRVNAELYATLLGLLANIRFVSVTDRFLSELAPVASGQVAKDSEMKYENLLQGLRHVSIKVWPPETFEEGAEFLETLGKCFANAHGLRMKTAFAETLLHLLHPIGKTAQAETNNPQWGRAIEIIYPKAKEMVAKPRYWSVAYPLLITSLCVAPQAFFLKHWYTCFEGSISKLKERPYRVPILNGLLRLLWTYIYRCPESSSATTSKLESLLKYFFPPNRISVHPQEEHHEPFIYMVHFILSRHFDYGADLCLELMQESAVKTTHSSSLLSVLAPERTSVAVQAILMTLHRMERDEHSPPWPSSADFTNIPTQSDYPSSSDFLPPAIMSRPGVQDLFERCSTVLGHITVACGNAVGGMLVFDEQWSYARLNPAYEESNNYVVRKRPEGAIAYPASFVPHISLLQTCFQSWPRCLPASISLSDAIDLLLRGVVHVEPVLGEAACEALKRFMADPTHAFAVLTRFSAFLFSPSGLTHDSAGARLPVDSPQLLQLWVDLVDSWIRKLIQQPQTTLTDEEALRCSEIEAGGLLLLSLETPSIHAAGVKVIRTLGLLVLHIDPKPFATGELPITFLRYVEMLHGRSVKKSYLEGYDELLDEHELARLEQWRQQTKRVDVPLRIADSTTDKDRKIWRYVFPSLLQASMEQTSHVLSTFRENLIAAVSRSLPFISHLAGLSSRAPPGISSRSTQNTDKDGQRLVRENRQLIEQWYVWIKILCATATLSETSRPTLTQLGRDHSRAPSDSSFERERLSTTRGLFRYLTPFLDSEYTQFRDAAVLCISSFPSSGYSQLLEDLSLLASRQFYDDARAKTPIVGDQSQHLASRQLLEDLRPKTGMSIVVERTRRQERLHSAVARIYYLTAHYLQHTRTGRQAALANVLKFVRNTQTFLTSPEARENFALQRLRRYFCGTVERLFDGLSTLNDSDRFIPPKMHLTLFHLCQGWCQIGAQTELARQQLIQMQRAVASSSQDSQEAVKRFQHETTLLSQAAIGAMASLCPKAYFPPEQSARSPTERPSPEDLKPLTAPAMMDRLSAIMASSHPPSVHHAKKALRVLLSSKMRDPSLTAEILKRAVVTSDSLDSESAQAFEVLSEVVSSSDTHPFSFSQAICLSLANLCHPHLEVRRSAFIMLEAVHHRTSGSIPMTLFDPTIGSQAAPAYFHAHRQVSEFLAGEHPSEALEMLSQLATWLPQINQIKPRIPLLLLQTLEAWITNIELRSNGQFTRDGMSSLYHLMSLTLRYASTYTEQILVLWMKLAEFDDNGVATALFLLQQSHKVSTVEFIQCSATIIACLCQTRLGKSIFAQLCSIIEPARMLPTLDHKLQFPDAADMELWSDLDALFENKPRVTLSSAQYAWLFLADVAFERHWEFKAELPAILHSIFIHLDYHHSFVRNQARRMLFQLLRSWIPGYIELPMYGDCSTLKVMIKQLEQEGDALFWRSDEPPSDIKNKMARLCETVVGLLEPLAPRLAERWGSLAVSWGTSCSIRGFAFRSLQIFRAILPQTCTADMALLLGRLSNTISSPDENIQFFTSEIIQTLTALTESRDLDRSFLPQLFWCACAALSTTVQEEFIQAMRLLEAVLDRVDLDDVTDILLSHQPPKWQGSPSLQPALLKGLRSSVTFESTFALLQRLSKVEDDRLVDASGGRVRDLYTAVLPKCLHAMVTDGPSPALKEFAEDIASLAEKEGRQSIRKIMVSFAKGHFRTKDDFLRQSVSSLREHYSSQWNEIDTLLLGLVFNQERWARIYSMQILKGLFQQRLARNSSELLGSELLMPLLRLLETDLAPNALEVLEEPIAMAGGGPPAKQVLRMSMHAAMPSRSEGPAADVFGVPEESGWCVAQAGQHRKTCHHNMTTVFDTCSVSSRPSRIDFEPEEELGRSPIDDDDDDDSDLGGLVQNLHDLSTFFQDDDEKSQARVPVAMIPNRRLEATVAAILAKSTSADAIPQTPFVDVFRVSGPPEFEDSDYSDSDDDDDDEPFVFDGPAAFRSALKGSSYH